MNTASVSETAVTEGTNWDNLSIVADMCFDSEGMPCFREAYVWQLRHEIASLKTLLKQGALSLEIWIDSVNAMPGAAPRTRRLIQEMRDAAAK